MRAFISVDERDGNVEFVRRDQRDIDRRDGAIDEVGLDNAAARAFSFATGIEVARKVE